nr:retrovirus-related Pol polyprotein from transposon TNT 1-94 [Tanacetum cinerariifolium]
MDPNYQTLHLRLFLNAVRFRNDHFGAIMGYGDYVVGDSVISKKVAKFVRDFKSLVKEADESLAKYKALEFEIERLLRAVVKKLENCIIKKEKEYAILWNDWYTKCDECKYDKISYDKAYNDMQQKIERLEAQLGDLIGKSKDIPGESDTIDSLSHKLENKNVELEFHLRAQLLDKVSEQKDTTKGMSTNTKFANQLIERKPSLQYLRNNFVGRQPNAFQSERTKFSKTRVPQKVDETYDFSNLVTSKSVPTPQESKVMKNDNVISLGMFRINPSKTSREDKFMPINKVRASIRTNSITVSQPRVITKKEVISDSNGLSSTGVDNTTKTRRPQPRSNTKNDRVYYASKSSCIKNNRVEVEEHHRNLLLFKNKKHITPQQNGIVERRNRTLVEAASTMLNFSRALLFLWAEAIATAYYTKNLSIIDHQFDKTPYELINGKKLDIYFLYVFGALYYPKNDREDIGKLGAKGDIDFFIGYSANSCAYRVYNLRTKKIIETMNVTFDELSAMAFE